MLVGIQIVFFLTPIVFGDQIPDYYKVQKFFPTGEQACDNSTAGPRHRVFCSGRLLEAVMAFNMYNDSKTFVDQTLKFYPDEVMTNFSIAFPTDDDITEEKLRTFLLDHFQKAGTELAGYKPIDHVPEPRKLRLIRDPELRNFAYALNNLWPSLAKSIREEMINESEKHTLIYVPNPFIVPGGRFREYYYWDTYWVIKGLIASGMHTMIRNILSNFVHIVNTYGMIPNGGRIYYLARSQPPLLSGMFYEYYEATGDLKFVEENIHVLEKELQFWDKHRTVNVTIKGESHVMFQFRAGSNVPRPESFREDVELVRNVESWKERSIIWRNLASAAESGLDFSSRWFKNQTELSTIDTTNVVPVELNAFICWNLNILSYFYGLIPGAGEREAYYRTRLFKFRSSFQKVFFVEKEDGWYDYNLRKRNNYIEFYPSNAIPLFTQCYDSMDVRKVERAFDRLRRFGAFGFNNGIPSSLHNGTRQQWDYPNSWPPFQHMLIDGLRRSESPQLQEEGYDLAKQWVRVNYENFKKSGKMWEKYNVDGDVGIGGEYPVQAGFGWTNGVILDLLVAYADRFDLQSIMETDRNLEIDFGVEEPRRVRPKKSMAATRTAVDMTIVVFGIVVFFL